MAKNSRQSKTEIRNQFLKSQGFLKKSEEIFYFSLLFFIFVLLFPKYRQASKLEKKLSFLEKQVKQLEKEEEKKKEKISLLKKNRDYLEVIARDKLDLKLPSEKVIRVIRK